MYSFSCNNACKFFCPSKKREKTQDEKQNNTNTNKTIVQGYFYFLCFILFFTVFKQFLTNKNKYSTVADPRDSIVSNILPKVSPISLGNAVGSTLFAAADGDEQL